MRNYLLAHGFGFTNDYWKNLIPLLDGNIYFLDDPKLDGSKVYVGIGHSLGFLKLNNSEFKFDALVALQGFLNYCGSFERIRNIREQNLAKVKNKIIENKKESLKQFRKFCGYQEAIETNIPLRTLIDELKMMENDYTHCGVKTLVIGSSDDVIVPMSIINDNFAPLDNVEIAQLNNGKHALGYLETKTIAETIHKYLAGCISIQ